MADRNSFRDKAKSIWLRGMKAVGNTAASIASNTRFKVDEMTLQNRRRELLGDVAGTAYSLWLKGEQFPEQVTNMLNELQQLDNELNDLRASKYTGEKKTCWLRAFFLPSHIISISFISRSREAGQGSS